MSMRDKLEQVAVKATLFPELEYIEREYAIAKSHGGVVYIDDIKEIPSADVAPIIHGRVVTTSDRWHVFHQNCSECGADLPWKEYPNYCYNCGAKLDLEDKDNE